MNINPTTSALPAAKLQQTAAAGKAYGAGDVAKTSTPRAADRLELTGMSHLKEMAKSGDVRADKIASIKAQIADGSYDLDAKADLVADRLLDALEL